MKYNLPCVTDRVYKNPVKYVDNSHHTNPDPYVIRYCGKYYCYSTDVNGVNVSTSTDLVNWKYKGYAICEDEYKDYWAPCVFYHNGLFYMYYSNVVREEDDCHQQFMKLAVSSNPIGPFEYVKTFFNKFSIDAHVVSIGKELYMFYSTNDIVGTDDNIAGTSILCDRLVGFDTLEGKPMVVITPSIKEEMFMANRFGDGRDWYTIEGAFYLEHHDKAYLMYSANAYVNTDYYIGYATAEIEDNIRDMTWEKYPNNYTYQPLVKRNEFVEGTGHNSVIKAPNLVDEWIVYHGRNGNDMIIEGTEQRTMRIDPIHFNGDRLITNAPSYEIQSAPQMPTYTINDVNINDSHIINRYFKYYIAEVSLKAELAHIGARYGIYLNFIDSHNYIELQFHSGNNEVCVLCCKNGIISMLEEHKLDSKYNHSVVHKINLVNKFNCYNIKIDDVTMIAFSCSMDAGKFGVSAYYSNLQVMNITMTEYIDLWKNDLKYLGELFRVDGVLKISNNGIVVNNHLAEIIKDKNTYECFVEEYVFGRLNNRFFVDCKLLNVNNDTICIKINHDECIIRLNDIEYGRFIIEDDVFSLKITQTINVIWICIDGNVIDIDRLFSTNKLEIKMNNLVFKGYRLTNNEQEINI